MLCWLRKPLKWRKLDESKKEIGLLKSKVSYRKEEEKISFMKDGKIREGGSRKFSRRN
jgi:hypothetical protein